MDRGGHRSDICSLINTVSFFVSHIQLCRQEVMQRCAGTPRKSSDGAGDEAAWAEGHSNVSQDSC